MNNTFPKPLFTLLLIAFLYIPNVSAIAEDQDYKKREKAVQDNMKLARRLENIVGPLRIKLADQCGAMTAPLIGAEFATTDSVGESYQAVMQGLYNTGLRPTVTMLAEHSPAANALKIGDMITHVNGKALTKGRDSLGEIKSYIRASKNKALNLSIDRGGKIQKITVKPVSACDKPARLAKGNKDIFVDERKIGVSKSVLKSGWSDAKIAAKIEEELRASLD